MVTLSGSVSYQSFNAQPALSTGDEPVSVKQEQVQPRQAPAAESQRSDQKSLASRDEPSTPRDRGSNVDIKA